MPHTHGHELPLEGAVCLSQRQQRLTAITIERHEMETAALPVTHKLRQNRYILYRRAAKCVLATLRQK